MDSKHGGGGASLTGQLLELKRRFDSGELSSAELDEEKTALLCRYTSTGPVSLTSDGIPTDVQARIDFAEQQSARYRAYAGRAKEMLAHCKSDIERKAERIATLEAALAARSVQRATAALAPQEEEARLSAATAAVLVEAAAATKLQNEQLRAVLHEAHTEAVGVLKRKCARLEARLAAASDNRSGDGGAASSTAAATAAAAAEASARAELEALRALQSKVRAAHTAELTEVHEKLGALEATHTEVVERLEAHEAQRVASSERSEARKDESRAASLAALAAQQERLEVSHAKEMNAMRHRCNEVQRVSSAAGAEHAAQHTALRQKCAELKNAWAADSEALRETQRALMTEHDATLREVRSEHAKDLGSVQGEEHAAAATMEAALQAASDEQSRLAESLASHATDKAAHRTALDALSDAIARSDAALKEQQHHHAVETQNLRALHEEQRDASLDGIAEAAAATRSLRVTTSERNEACAALVVAEGKTADAMEKMRHMAAAFEEYKEGLATARAEFAALQDEVVDANARVAALEAELEAERRAVSAKSRFTATSVSLAAEVGGANARVAELEAEREENEKSRAAERDQFREALCETTSRASDLAALSKAEYDALAADFAASAEELTRIVAVKNAEIAGLEMKVTTARSELRSASETQGRNDTAQSKKIETQAAELERVDSSFRSERAALDSVQLKYNSAVREVGIEQEKNAHLRREVSRLEALAGLDSNISALHHAVVERLAKSRGRVVELEKRIITLSGSTNAFQAEAESRARTIQQLQSTSLNDSSKLDAAAMQIQKLGALVVEADLRIASKTIALHIAGSPRSRSPHGSAESPRSNISDNVSPPVQTRVRHTGPSPHTGGGTPLPLPIAIERSVRFHPNTRQTSLQGHGGGGTPLPPPTWKAKKYIRNGALRTEVLLPGSDGEGGAQTQTQTTQSAWFDGVASNLKRGWAQASELLPF